MLAGLLRIEEGNLDPASVHIVDLLGVIDHSSREVAVRLIELANAIGVFVQLGRVVGTCEQILKQQRMGQPDRLKVLHGANHLAVGERGVPVNDDVADLYLRPFVDRKGDVYTAGRNLANLWSYVCILMTALCFVFLEHVLRPLHFARVILRFRRQADLPLFQAV